MKKYRNVLCAVLSTLPIVAFLLSGCGKDYSNYINTNGYNEYISVENSGCEDVPYFGIENAILSDIKAKNYYNNNCRKCGSYLITNFKEGICINRYLGISKNINIPSELDGKPVIMLGEFISNERDEAYAEDEAISYGAFGGVKDCKIHIPSTVKYISRSVFMLSYGIVADLDEKYRNSFYEITVDRDNPFYCAENNCIFSKDKKTLLYVNDDEYDKYEVYSVPKFVESFEPLNAIPDSSLKQIEFSENIEKIKACIDLGEDGVTPNKYVKSDVIVKGYKNTVAESWAEQQGLTFVSCD